MPAPTLETPRLLLEPLGPEHARPLFPLLAERAVWEHIGRPDAPSPEELEVRYARVAAGPGPHRPAGETWINFAVRLREADRVIGRVEATVHDRGAWAEVAYLLGTAWWGQGLAAEATCALRDHLRARGTRELWAATRPENGPSRRLLERLGFVAAPSGLRPLASEDPGDLLFVWRG